MLTYNSSDRTDPVAANRSPHPTIVCTFQFFFIIILSAKWCKSQLSEVHLCNFVNLWACCSSAFHDLGRDFSQDPYQQSHTSDKRPKLWHLPWSTIRQQIQPALPRESSEKCCIASLVFDVCLLLFVLHLLHGVFLATHPLLWVPYIHLAAPTTHWLAPPESPDPLLEPS